MEKKYYAQLDGVRALLVMLVVASHTNAMKMTGQGGLAVAAFFALSGFLVVLPWRSDGEECFCSVKYIGQFYLKRAIRLLPVYYVLILANAWLTNSLDSIKGDLLFTNSSGHLWFLQQELLMYLLAPFIVLFIYFLKKTFRLNNLWIGFILLILACLLQEYLTLKVFYLMGNGKKQSFRIGLFLTGMAFGYFYKSGKFPCLKKHAVKWVADAGSLILVAASVFSAAYFIERVRPELTAYYVGWEHPFACAVLSSILYLLLLVNREGWISRIFSNPLAVSVGKMSYVIYLVHYYLIPYTTLATCKQIFMAVFLLSAGIALLTNELIEKPLRHCLNRGL